jgi:hypothetical protein
LGSRWFDPQTKILAVQFAQDRVGAAQLDLAEGKIETWQRQDARRCAGMMHCPLAAAVGQARAGPLGSVDRLDKARLKLDGFRCLRCLAHFGLKLRARNLDQRALALKLGGHALERNDDATQRKRLGQRRRLAGRTGR